MEHHAAPTCTGCSRTFVQYRALTTHQRSCKKTNKRASEALGRFQEIIEGRKKLRLDDAGRGAPAPTYQQPYQDTPELFLQTDQCGGLGLDDVSPLRAISLTVNQSKTQEVQVNPQTPGEPPDVGLSSDLDCPIAVRRPRRAPNPTPKCYVDVLPQPLPSMPPSGLATLVDPPPRVRVLKFFESPRNVFGLRRKYYSTGVPLDDPEESTTLTDISTVPIAIAPDQTISTTNIYFPYPNKSSFLLGDWYWSDGVQKSQQSFKNLISIVGDPSFDPLDVRNTHWTSINTVLGSSEHQEPEDGEWVDVDAGWIRSPIRISVPFHSGTPSPGTQQYSGGDLYRRPLVGIIRERIGDPCITQGFHLEPYELNWSPHPASYEIPVYGELYTSPSFLKAHHTLQNLPAEPGCDLQRVVVALMFWSDATHLTSFGTTKIWPLYLYFGNESKYRRCRPTSGLCCHVAYFQEIPDSFKDFVTSHAGSKGLPQASITHCRREFLHEQWKAILDDEFIDAYKHGVVIKCRDGFLRRFFPRIFTYAADYPEKVLFASIRNKGGSPCPRCLIPLHHTQNLGQPQDRQERTTLRRFADSVYLKKVVSARKWIYGTENKGIKSKYVEDILKLDSIVPTSNAFVEKLGPLGFNPFPIFVVDLMHEVELGTWKHLFIHILRVIDAQDPGLLNEVDYRFRRVPSFGCDTIRKFSSNTSEMKKLGARDFEDILQCSIPVFDGLLPEPHNTVLMRLLFLIAHWHGLAKLRLHTELTLGIMDRLTTELGEALREFEGKVCGAYVTLELPREVAARERKQKVKEVPSQTKSPPIATIQQPKNAGTTYQREEPKRQKKSLNLQTYKYHSLGDYVDSIRQFGTTDSYSTETGELEHRSPKARYLRTDRKAFVKQLTQIERRHTRIRRIRQKVSETNQRHPTSVNQPREAAVSPEQHHSMGRNENTYDEIGSFLRTHAGDPATKDFLPKLKAHILPRILDALQIENPTHFHTLARPIHDSSLDLIMFKHNRMYTHNIFRVNYTTYDVRRAQDVINPKTSHCDVLFLAEDGDNPEELDAHPFLYGRIIKIYHVNVVYTGPGSFDFRPRRFEFLWVRWFEHLEPFGSWASCSLDRLCFPPLEGKGAFGFVNPSDVLRGCHIIPSFSKGMRYTLPVDAPRGKAYQEAHALPKSVRPHKQGWSMSACDSDDYNCYYVNRFVDRDTLMRYHKGLGVGHIYIPLASDKNIPPSDIIPVRQARSLALGGEPPSAPSSSNNESRDEMPGSNGGSQASERVHGLSVGGPSSPHRKSTIAQPLLDDDDVYGSGSDDDHEEKDDRSLTDEGSDDDLDLEYDDMYGDPLDLDYED